MAGHRDSKGDRHELDREMTRATQGDGRGDRQKLDRKMVEGTDRN